jgi:uncharacterized membrane protein
MNRYYIIKGLGRNTVFDFQDMLVKTTGSKTMAKIFMKHERLWSQQAYHLYPLPLAKTILDAYHIYIDSVLLGGEE